MLGKITEYIVLNSEKKKHGKEIEHDRVWVFCWGGVGRWYLRKGKNKSRAQVRGPWAKITAEKVQEISSPLCPPVLSSISWRKY